MKRILLIVTVIIVGSNLMAQSSLESAGLKDKLVAYFSFDKNTENTIRGDVGSGAASEGTLKGATITEEAKYSGSAISFDGVDDVVEFIGNQSEPFRLKGENQLSVAVWVKPMKINKTKQRIVSLSHSYYLEIAEDNNFNSFLALQKPTGEFCNAYARAVFRKLKSSDTGEWFHVAFSYDGANTTIYVNGAEIVKQEAKQNDGLIVPFDKTLYLGAGLEGGHNGPKYFKGNMDELYIYNRALSNEDITELMNMEKPL